jgi:sec-independent protein translocase protein TatC
MSQESEEQQGPKEIPASHAEELDSSAIEHSDSISDHSPEPHAHDHGDSHPVHSDSHPVDEEEEGGGPVKSFLEHLEDLRWTILKSGSALVVGMIACLIAAPKLFAVMQRPIKVAAVPMNLEWFSPTGGVMSSLKIAFYSGLVLGLPLILFFLGQFIVPALKTKEKKYFFTAFSIGTGFFLAGVVTCYFVILPISLKALVQYNNWLGVTTNTWRAEDYFEFASKFLLGVGLLFEIPVLILTLVKVELLQTQTLVNGRRYMLVGNFVICAVLTPADLVTTFLMAMALQVLYEGCIWVAKYWDRQRRHHMETGASLTPPRSGRA